MKIGVNLLNFGPGADPDGIARWTWMAEMLGYHFAMISDHVAVTDDVAARYPAPFYEPFTSLGWLAAHTTKITLGTTVVIVPYRHPLETARMIANLDHLSGGRLIFGVGVGGENPREFELAGVPHGERGARVTEGIDVVRALWRDGPATFKGRFTHFEGVSIDPKPVQAGGPPIWIGGRSDAALARAGRQGDGWVSYVVTPERYAQSLAKIRAAAQAQGRSLDGFATAHLTFITVGRDYERARQAWVQRLSRRYAQDFGPLAQKYGVIGTPEQCCEQLERFRAAGCRTFLINAICDPDEEREQIETIGAEILPRFRPS